MRVDASLTRVLNAFFAGDAKRGEEVVTRVYDELHQLALRMSGPEGAAPIDATGLVHEAWIRLSGSEGVFASRRQFYALAARVMRSVLIDHARARAAWKRGGQSARVTLSGLFDEGAGDAAAGRELDVLDLHEALERLAELDPVLHALVELRFFSGLSQAEIAEELGLSLSTVERRWRLARAWLRGELGT